MMDSKHLPIWSIMPAVLGAMRQGRNVVLTAPPGSGKSTQVPQAVLDDAGVAGRILVVQPRRVACRAVARRVAEERFRTIGEEVGYIVRYDNKSSYDTKLLFITDGVLLRFLERDPSLAGVGTVIFDEFHERRANMDLALGLLKLEQQRRKTLRLVVMSATMDGAGVARYLDADILCAEGRAYPVEVSYASTRDHDDAVARVRDQVINIHRWEAEGDVLVFLSGKEEIRRVQGALKMSPLEGLTILPLHGELPKEEQDRVFDRVVGRKVVLATNIAETSVTIPGIRYVVDTGFERRSDFDSALGINKLTLTRISKASAEQRAGRAGREAPGKCWRLWNESTQVGLISYAPVETQRIDLSSAVLTLKGLGIIEPLSFDFLDAPASERVAAGEEQLVHLGAIGSDRRLTSIGWKMLRLPLPPRYARMVVEAERCGCLTEIATIASLLCGRPTFSGSIEKGKDELEAFEYARDGSSTLFSLLDVFNAVKGEQYSPEACERFGMSLGALREAAKLRRKVISLAATNGGVRGRHSGNRAAMRRCVLAGLVDRVVEREPWGSYRTIQGTRVALRSGEKMTSRLIAAADIRSGKGIASLHLVTQVEAEMLEQVAPHLIEHVRIPISLDADKGQFTVCEEKRYFAFVLSSATKKVDLLERLQVIAEQTERASKHAWQRVEVQPGISRRSVVLWEGVKVPVRAEHAGPHWASISLNPLTVQLHERIVLPPILTVSAEPEVPARLQEKLSKTAHVLAKLTGRSS